MHRRRVEQMIAAVWAMEQSEQMLIINGGVVGDDETLDAYSITDNTVVHLGWKQHKRSTRNNRLIVKNGQVTCYMIMWNSHDTTDFIRDRIAEKTGIIETMDIIMTHGNGTLFLNGLLLRSCNLKHDDTITWGLNQNLPVCLPDAGGFSFAMLGRNLPVCLPDAGGFSFADPSGVKAPLPTPAPTVDHDNDNATLVGVVLAALVMRFAQWQWSGSSIGTETAASVQCRRFASWLSNSHARIGLSLIHI